MVADCGCNRKRIQRVRREITGVFNFTLGGILVWSLFLRGLNLVAGREDKARILVALDGLVQRGAPVERVVTDSGGLCGVKFRCVLSLCGIGRTNLRVTDINKGETIAAVLYLERSCRLIADLVVVRARLKVGSGSLAGIILRVLAVLDGSLTGDCLLLHELCHCCIRCNAEGSCRGFGIPCEVHLGVIGTRGKRYLCPIIFHGLPALLPCSIGAVRRSRCCRCIGVSVRCCCGKRRKGTARCQNACQNKRCNLLVNLHFFSLLFILYDLETVQAEYTTGFWAIQCNLQTFEQHYTGGIRGGA